MTSAGFVKDLDSKNQMILGRLGEFDALALEDGNAIKSADVGKLLKIALKNELESCQLAASWLPSTPEVDVKLALARQGGDEAYHYELIAQRLGEMKISLDGFNPTEGRNALFNYLLSLNDTAERIAGGLLTLESIAAVKNEQFIKLCKKLGDARTAELYENLIQRDERHHYEVGRKLLERHAVTPEGQGKATSASLKVLQLAEELQGLARQKLGIVCGPGC